MLRNKRKFEFAYTTLNHFDLKRFLKLFLLPYINTVFFLLQMDLFMSKYRQRTTSFITVVKGLFAHETSLTSKRASKMN